MKNTIPTRLGYGAGAAVLAAAAMLGIASTSATADVNSVSAVPSSEGNPSAVLVEYDIAENDPLQDDACFSPSSPSSAYRYVDALLTVSETGDYLIADPGSEENIPDEFSPATTQRDVADGYYSVLRPDGSCAADTSGENNFADTRTAQLEANVTYTLRLNHFNVEDVPGVFAALISGPGTVTVTDLEGEPEGVSFEQAQAACIPGAAAPAGYNVIDGTSRNETLRGTEGNDLIRGLGGQDTLLGLGGDDILCGGAGQDTLRGGAGEDFLFGEAGQDALYGEADDDVLAGGDGNDFHDGGAGSDVALDTVGSNTFRNIESRTLEPAPQPTATANR